jgi:hypothetical protein
MAATLENKQRRRCRSRRSAPSTRFTSRQPRLARATYLDATNAALFAGPLTGPEASVLDVAEAARAAAACGAVGKAADLFVDGLATRFSEGYPAGLPILRRRRDASLGRSPSRTRGNPQFARPRTGWRISIVVTCEHR